MWKVIQQMTSETPRESEITSPRRAATGRSIIAWLVIVAVSLTIILLHVNSDDSSAGRGQQQTVDSITDRMQGRLLVGMGSIGSGDSARMGLQGFMVGSLEHRLRGVILVGELEGTDAARDLLMRTEVQMSEAGYEPDELQRDLIGSLDRIYSSPPVAGDVPGGLDVPQQEQLESTLGWFGTLALHPKGRGPDPIRSLQMKDSLIVLAIMSVMGSGIVIGLFVGTVLLIVVIVLGCKRRLRHSLGSASIRDGLLAETFALWLVVFLLLQIGLQELVRQVPSLQQNALLLVGVVQGATVLAVFWPVLRGRSWADTRRSIGWTTGPEDDGSWLRELGWGLCGYLMMLPFLAIGVLLVYVLMAITSPVDAGTSFSSSSSPSHPIILQVAGGSVWTIVQVYFVAAVVAPFLEETVFRGVLYRQLRSATGRWRIGWSVALSIFVVSLVFAAIHPQGLVAIPALAAIAVGLGLMREWRGSLIAPMVMHACSNGIVVTLMVLVAR
ncbi:MAG: hypothetical protein CMJ24_05130 [Phycisphaerae bacterium]|nr:hypothetical protein [Phycisphaerae bacterium]|tara:strand:+ start:784 stop:2277 length:1494 start_codon:yes stop_codon:yes gene_type:complete